MSIAHLTDRQKPSQSRRTRPRSTAAAVRFGVRAAPARAAARAGRPSCRRRRPRRRRRPPPPRRRARPRRARRRGREAGVHGGDLARMDAQLGAEAQAPRAPRVGLERRGIVDRGADAVDRRGQAGQARREHELRAEEEQLVAVAFDAEVELQVDRAERRAAARRARRRSRAARSTPTRGLDQRQQRGAAAQRRARARGRRRAPPSAASPRRCAPGARRARGRRRMPALAASLMRTTTPAPPGCASHAASAARARVLGRSARRRPRGRRRPHRRRWPAPWRSAPGRSPGTNRYERAASGGIGVASVEQPADARRRAQRADALDRARHLVAAGAVAVRGEALRLVLDLGARQRVAGVALGLVDARREACGRPSCVTVTLPIQRAG